MKKNNLQICMGTFLAAALVFGQTVQADELILRGNQTISDDADVSVIIVGNSGANSTSGDGHLIVNSGATLANFDGNSPTLSGRIDGVEYHHEDGYLGFNAGSTGTATVTGEDTLWDNSSGGLYTGYLGQALLVVEEGGRVVSEQGYLGYQAGSTGAAVVTGVDSRWDNLGNLYIGGNASSTGGQGNLVVNDGGVVSADEGATIWSVGSLAGKGGMLEGDVINHGLISPGNSANPFGVLTITGDLVLEESSTLVFEIFDPTLYDQLFVNGDFTMGGSLALDFDNFIQSAFDTTYDLIQVGGNLTGTWDNFDINTSTGFDSSLLTYSVAGSDSLGYSQVLRLTVAGVGNPKNPIPEPATVLLIGLGGMMMLWQWRRSALAS
ncbi:PEP-CTERM sorting domain-containing protein [Nitrosomonas eutropha]|uniref:Secreted protein with PEP-CTERM sorting signal n=2 Tax=Nitrosomonas eutropha TaxID=916 RepID=A0ABX5M954_9PROT|nr:PEP-CTERM sorting domain-containing protein [Nitrosomonas eutropha]ABI58980.1 PEP motif putative anchor-like protein [Nitrosomonas eutropha C91]PXV82208.1 putative secreted protein with PEP-CTERM sorting signal [Nitrosomonas eutropha]SEI81193.1 PEP-CTERM protein-sorting domain-containing protein [Nitrosomonas eutropha]